MTIAAIAWDIDGTLVDSEPLHHRALLAAGRQWDADLSDIGDDTFVGVHMHDVWTALASRFPADLGRQCWLAAVEDHYVERAAELVPIADVAEAIRSFAAEGLSQVCVSNSSRRVVDANLEAIGVAGDIAFSISLDDVGHGKPDPEPYRAACARLALPPHRVVAVEDSRAGLASARAAGLRTAAFGPLLAGSEADVTLAAFADLVRWVHADRSKKVPGGAG